MEEPTLVVPDTNVFLHCRALEELPWGSLTESDVDIVLVDPVISELDHWKDQGNDRRAKRVRKILPMLRALASSEPPVVDLYAGPPRLRLRLDSTTCHISEGDNDSAIIEAAGSIAEHNSSRVIVLTRDVLMAIRCKRRSIECYLIAPESAEWNLDPERPDPQFNELKKELNELKQQRPLLDFEVQALGEQPCAAGLTISLPRLAKWERLEFITEWARAYFAEHDPKIPSLRWDLDDYSWTHDLARMDDALRIELTKRAAGATMCIVLRNSGSVNAEDVRIEVLVEGAWLVARSSAELTFEVPRPPLLRTFDERPALVPVLPNLDSGLFDTRDPEAPVWERQEGPGNKEGVQHLAIRLRTLRHRTDVEIPFRLGTNMATETSGKLVIRVSTEKAPRPIVKTFNLKLERTDRTLREFVTWLSQRNELRISKKTSSR